MENGTEEIFKEQLKKLPSEVVSFISSSTWEEDLDEICSLFNLSEDSASGFKREATLAVLGIVHPDAFATMLEQEVGIKGAVLEALVLNVEKKIFAPIRPALVEFFNSETAIENEGGGASLDSVTARNEAVQHSDSGLLRQSTDSQRQEPLVPTVPPVPHIPRKPDIAPENLPTEEVGESFLPTIPLKFGAESASATVHPFEEKMKKVFTAGQQSLGDLAIEPPSQTSSPTQASKAPPIYHADPYREAIE